MKKVFFLAAIGVIVATVGFDRPASAQEHPHHGPAIVSPADGATVSSPLTVTVGVPGGMPQGAADDQSHGHHGGHGQLYLVIDAAAPEAGSTVETDANHLAFPQGEHQMTVDLPAGPHSLRLVHVGPDGQVGRRGGDAPAVTVTVQ